MMLNRLRVSLAYRLVRIAYRLARGRVTPGLMERAENAALLAYAGVRSGCRVTIERDLDPWGVPTEIGAEYIGFAIRNLGVESVPGGYIRRSE